MEIKITIIYPSDPLGLKIGGTETSLINFIKSSPEDFCIEYVGISSDKKTRPPKKWHECLLNKKHFQFYPLFTEKDENKKTLIPLSLRFTVSLKLTKLDLSRCILLFNRIEPAMIFTRIPNPRIAIIHTSIKNHIDRKKSEVLWGKIPLLYRWFESFLFPHFDQIFTVSRDSLSYYRQRYADIRDRFLFLENCVDSSIFFPTNQREDSLKSSLSISTGRDFGSGPWILFVGRLQEAKAPMRLLDSFRLFSQKNPSSSLIIIGEGDLKNVMSERVEHLGIIKMVFFISALPQPALADFYRASDILLLTSNFEGMPMCVLEALSCGIPVVSTNVGEVGKVVRRGYSGEVVDSFDPKEIAMAMDRVIKHQTEYTHSNCQDAVSNFMPQKSFSSIYDKIRSLYLERYVTL